jgi:hypothetical protein
MARIGTDPVALGAGFTSAYTVSIGMQATLIELNFLNLDSVARIPTARMVPNGATPGNSHEVIGGDASSLNPGETMTYRLRQFLKVGDSIQWKASAGAAITAWVAAIEALADAKYISKDAQFLDTVIATLHTVTANKQATLVDLMLHNQDTVTHTPTVYFVPNGGSVGNGNAIVGVRSDLASQIKPGETLHYNFNLFLGGGVTIQAKADSANKIVAKLSVPGGRRYCCDYIQS